MIHVLFLKIIYLVIHKRTLLSIMVHANEAILLNSNILQHFNLSLIETDRRYSRKEVIE